MQTFTRFLVLVIIHIFGLSVFASPLDWYPVGDSLRYKDNPNYSLQLGYYDVYKTKQADIVMLGNSITHGANWNELLARPNVVSRGIPSDILEGFLARMDYIYKLNPKICFIMGGVNDIYSWIPVETVFEQYIAVINGLRLRKIQVVIQSTLHTAPFWGKEWIEANQPGLNVRDYNAERNRQISRLNQMLSDYARKNGIEFIDLNKSMSSNDFLKSQLTWDGTHLNGNGYKIWSTAVDNILKKYHF